jgi:hypothetical protein
VPMLGLFVAGGQVHDTDSFGAVETSMHPGPMKLTIEIKWQDKTLEVASVTDAVGSTFAFGRRVTCLVPAQFEQKFYADVQSDRPNNIVVSMVRRDLKELTPKELLEALMRRALS